MIRRDIREQWRAISCWYWNQYQALTGPTYTIWQILERDHGARRVSPLDHPKWSVVDFPDEQAYTWFLLKWA
jgi:hypothetical protein